MNTRRDNRPDLPNFRDFCEAACVKLWGDPDSRNARELRWDGADAYSAKTFNRQKKAWYDHGEQRGGSTLDLVAYDKGQPKHDLKGAAFFDTWAEAHRMGIMPVEPPAKPNGQGGPILATYPYHDEAGQPLFEVVRFDATDPADRFRQRRPDGAGGWIWDTKGVRTQVLFRLPRLIEALKAGQRVLITEGERDCNTAVALGFAATTMPGGAGKWRSEYNCYFQGADVVIVSDNDPQATDPKTGAPRVHPNGAPVLPGQEHAAAVARHVRKVAAHVRLILPGEHKDLTAWREAGGTKDALEALIDRAPDYTRDDPSPAPGPSPDDGPPRPRSRRSPPADRPPWFGELRRDERGRVYPDLRNVLIALRREPQTVSAFHFDEMAQDPIVAQPPPLAPDAKPSPPPPRPLTDDDVTRLQEWLQHVGMPRVGREIVRQAVEASAREHRFHPIRVWLDALEWDGVPRLASWLRVCLGTPEDEYHRQVGSMFVIAMVARIYQPGCKADYMIVLEGPQGEEKSKLCRVLAGGDAFFSEHLPRIDGDQVRLSMHLKGKWLIEVAELAAMLRADPEGTKHFISRQIEKYTPKYGRGEVIEPRQCLFIGSTNEDDYIRDVTGGRRYWPVVAVVVDLDALAAMRAQLFAEAVDAYRHDKPWWPDRRFEKATIAPIQDERQFDDALAEKVQEVLDPLSEITLAHLGSRIGFDNTRFDMAAQKRVAAILKRAKWRKGKSHEGGRIWRKA